MARFLYLTDTHLGCDAAGYHLQPRYLGATDALFAGLERWLREHPVDGIIHGGDLTDHGTVEQIDEAVRRFARLGVPTWLCLGNHDLAKPGSMQAWRTRGTAFVPDGADSYGFRFGAASIYVVGHHWTADRPHYWPGDGPGEPRLDAAQEQALDAFLKDAVGPVIVVTHAPIHAVTPTQTGLNDPFHPPHAPYLETFTSLAARRPNLRLVLCGHNHVQSTHDHGGFVSCTTSAFNEIPAQARLVTVDTQAIEVATVRLAGWAGLPEELSADTSWAAGPPGPIESQRIDIPIA